MLPDIDTFLAEYVERTPSPISKDIGHSLRQVDGEDLANVLTAVRSSTQHEIAPVPEDTKPYERLIEAFENELLVVVLGAGVSRDLGVPDWNTLLQKLLFRSILANGARTKEVSGVLARLFAEVFSPNPLIAARFLQNRFENTAQNGHVRKKGANTFADAIRRVLYEKVGNKRKTAVFEEIGKMCVRGRRGGILEGIITYNYDDCLERYLTAIRDIEIPYCTVYSAKVKPKVNELPIYHVHGYLPRKGNVDNERGITLSEQIYHYQYSQPYTWNNLLQLNKFQERTCLFLGLSFADPNLRRLLDIANSLRGNTETVHHYVVKKRYDRENVRQGIRKALELTDELQEEKARAEIDLDSTVAQLVEIAETFEENDLLSLGVQTIWIDDFAQNAAVLKRIRRGT